MTERYQVTLHSQMGPRQGILSLQYQGERITGSLELMGYRNTVRGARAADGTLRLRHSIRTAVRTLPCDTVLEIAGRHLAGESVTQPCRIRWEGVTADSGCEATAAKETKP